MTPNADANPPKPNSTWRRIHRAGAVLFYVVSCAWITWIALTRWNGRPADPDAISRFQSGIGVPIDPETDRTEELQEALDRLPPIPTFTLPPPPEGMMWVSPPTGGGSPMAWAPIAWEALDGEWTPETRPVLEAIVKHLESPEVIQALDLLASIEPGGIRSANHSAMRETVGLLGARMRYQCSQRNDADAAIKDYRTALRLAGLNYGSGSLIHMFVGAACEMAAHEELIRLAMEFPFSQDQARKVQAIIEQESPDDERLWQAWGDALMPDLRLLVDSFWTQDDDGNGWFVLSEWRADTAFLTPEAACGAWNMLSPLFAKRTRVSGKMAALKRACESVSGMSYADGRVILIDATQRFAFTHLDGPFAFWSDLRPARYLFMNARRTASRRAAIIAAALSAYHSYHGDYPNTLAELQSEYLQTALLDPFVNEDFRYLRQNNDTFILYSVGPNCVDDHGAVWMPESTQGAGREVADFVFTTPRVEPESEPILTRIEQDDREETSEEEPAGKRS
jgi:hypothetical protein